MAQPVFDGHQHPLGEYLRGAFSSSLPEEGEYTVVVECL